MDLNDLQNLNINGKAFQKLIRISDGAVIFEKTAQPKPYFEISYDTLQGSVAIFTLRANYGAQPFDIEWGDGQTTTITPGGQTWIYNVRHNYTASDVKTIRMPGAVSFFNLQQNKSTITTIKDYGANLDFQYIGSSPAEYQWVFPRLSLLDISRRDTVPYVQTAGFLDNCPNLNDIYVNKTIYQQYITDQKWSLYTDKIRAK